eukprot:7416427-Pyramimonas_sp.AAC.1
MAWILARDDLAAKKHVDLQFRLVADTANELKSKPEVILAFMDPGRSPVWDALSEGSCTLRESGYWQCVKDFNRSTADKDAIR